MGDNFGLEAHFSQRFCLGCLLCKCESCRLLTGLWFDMLILISKANLRSRADLAQHQCDFALYVGGRRFGPSDPCCTMTWSLKGRSECKYWMSWLELSFKMSTSVNRLKLSSGCLGKCRNLARSTAHGGGMDGAADWIYSSRRYLNQVVRIQILKVLLRASIWHAIQYFKDQIGLRWSCRISWWHHRPLHLFFCIWADWRPSRGQFGFLRIFFKAKQPFFH